MRVLKPAIKPAYIYIVGFMDENEFQNFYGLIFKSGFIA